MIALVFVDSPEVEDDDLAWLVGVEVYN